MSNEKTPSKGWKAKEPYAGRSNTPTRRYADRFPPRCIFRALQ